MQAFVNVQDKEEDDKSSSFHKSDFEAESLRNKTESATPLFKPKILDQKKLFNIDNNHT